MEEGLRLAEQYEDTYEQWLQSTPVGWWLGVILYWDHSLLEEPLSTYQYKDRNIWDKWGYERDLDDKPTITIIVGICEWETRVG